VHVEVEHAKIGDMIDVTIEAATLNSLKAVINSSSSNARKAAKLSV
jgi:biotin synthase-related radical SAM superfamily protein